MSSWRSLDARNLAPGAARRKAGPGPIPTDGVAPARGTKPDRRAFVSRGGRRFARGRGTRMIFLYAFAFAAGIANAFQAGTNASLAKALNQPFLAGLLVVGVSALALAAAGLASGRLSMPSAGSFAEVPWWAWIGGVLSSALLLSQLFVADRIGAGPFLGIIVATGTVTSLAIDHYGWVGFKVHELNLWRALGGALMAGGVLLIALF